MREKLTNYSFKVIWMPGKTHHRADTLSSALMIGPYELAFEPEDINNYLRLFDTSRTHLNIS